MEWIHINVLVQSGFVPTELALVQDCLRIANRLSRDVQFDVEICTASDAGFIEGLGNTYVKAAPVPEDGEFQTDTLVVLGGIGVREDRKPLLPILRRSERMGKNMILLSDAATAWKELYPNVDNITLHWEDCQLRDMARGTPLPLYAQRGRVVTAAGMAATADVILNLLVAPVSHLLARQVSNILLVGKIRNDLEDQPRSEHDQIALRAANLERAITTMEENIEDPISMTELAKETGLSIRQFERRFKAHLGKTPAAFYRSLRLRRARMLVEQTDMPICDVAIACGFGSSSNFSKHFQREYGVSPSRYQVGSLPMRSLVRPRMSAHLRHSGYVRG